MLMPLQVHLLPFWCFRSLYIHATSLSVCSCPLILRCRMELNPTPLSLHDWRLHTWEIVQRHHPTLKTQTMHGMGPIVLHSALFLFNSLGGVRCSSIFNCVSSGMHPRSILSCWVFSFFKKPVHGQSPVWSARPREVKLGISRRNN